MKAVRQVGVPRGIDFGDGGGVFVVHLVVVVVARLTLTLLEDDCTTVAPSAQVEVVLTATTGYTVVTAET